jgi:transposase
MTRLNVGVDVSKDSLDVAYWEQEQDKAVFQDEFPNNQKGFRIIERNIERKCKEIDATSVLIVMEPTGGYEQRFAHFAYQQHWEVSLPNPYRVKHWAGATGVRAKTDKGDAKTLAHYAFIQDPSRWKPLPPAVEQMGHLNSRLADLKETLRREKNRWHSAQNHVIPQKGAVRSHKQTIAFLERQILQIQKSIKEHLKEHPRLKEQKKLLLTIPGVGEKNVLYILVMMYRWDAFTNGEGDNRGVVAYAGLDPKPHESGTTVRRRASISRQGNRPFRSRLYMSALGGIKGRNSPLTTFYKRLVGRGKPKKVALVAASRKILIWSWAVFRTNTPFDTTRFEIAQ